MEDADDQEKYSLSFDSCLEMLEVLANEFGDMIPLETQAHILEA